MKNFDFVTHNRKIATLRGNDWRSKLIQSKMESVRKPSVLRRIRVSQDYSQAEMASIKGLGSLAHYGRIERREAAVPSGVAQAIADKLEADVKRLFRKDGEWLKAV